MTGGYLERPAPSGLADVIEIILDKGIVIDAYLRVSLVGIEVLTLDARVVIASVDTCLRFAEATNRLDLYEHGGRNLADGLVELGGEVVEKTATKVVEKKVGGLMDKAAEIPEAVEKKVSGAMHKAAEILPTPGSD